MPERLGPATSRPHTCSPACPGQPGGTVTAEQQREAYDHHRGELEAGLAAQLAAERRYAAGRRPAWWWSFAEEAAAYRADPSRWERPEDLAYYAARHAAVTAPDAAGEFPGGARRPNEVAPLRYLAARGLLERWEVETLLERAARGADFNRLQGKAVREGLRVAGR